MMTRTKISLTCVTRFKGWSDSYKSMFLFPLKISSIMIPKLKTSDFTEKRPSMAYSGDI